MTPHRLAKDLYEIEAAALAGATDHDKGFPIAANPYTASLLRNLREGKLHAWAWALGWRETEWLRVRKMKGAI